MNDAPFRQWPDAQLAALLAHALEARAITLDGFKRWADRQIVEAEGSPTWLIRASLAPNLNDALAWLHDGAVAQSRFDGPEVAVFLLAEGTRHRRPSVRNAIERAFSVAIEDATPDWLKQAVYKVDELLSYSLQRGGDGEELRETILALADELARTTPLVAEAREILHACE